MKILYLIKRHTFNHKMSRVRFDSIYALKRYLGNSLKISGPGYPDFKSARQMELEYKPHIIIWYKPLEMSEYDKVETPRCLRYNEMWDREWTSKEIRTSKSNLVICHHYNDIGKYNDRLDPKQYKLVHNPHCAETRKYRDFEDGKTIDVLYIGQGSKKFYPLRKKLREKVLPMLANKGIRVKVYNHPGYKLKGLKKVNEQVERYAWNISRAKIVVTCGSIYNYALAKYSEVPLCRTALCANIPGENKEWFLKWMIPIDNNMSAAHIKDKIIGYLRSPEELKEKTELGYHENFFKRSQEEYAKRFIKMADDFLSGEMDDYDFTTDKQRYLNGGDGVYNS